ncbi:MAG: hypothetical protein E7553_06855 [Ruminococcaceae bacterium]|nr:hypothetical protein [Oscillospiraceae bacterium]
MKRLFAKCLGVFCAVALFCSMFGLSASAITGGGGAGTGSIHAWGCDMSYYNTQGSTNFGLVDFAKMKADGCEFVILRIGYEGLSSGLRNQDTSFVKLYNMAREAGMKIGVYYYTCRMTNAGAVADANWCIDIMKANNMYFEYPIYYDVEYPGDSSAGRKSHEDLSASETTSLCLGWAETLANAGYFPGVYAGYYVLADLQSSYTNNYDTWIASVKSATTGAQYNPWSDNTSYRSKYGMWQYKWYNQGGTQVYAGAYWKDSYGYPLDCNVAFKDYPTIMQTYGYNNMVTRHKISFETNGGSAVDPVYVTDGQALTEPTAPYKYAFDFGGWYCNPELTDPYDFSSPVPYDFTLYAKWDEQYWGANTNLMPNEQQMVLNDFNGQGAIWPYWNNDEYGSVTFYNGVTNDDNWSWPSAYMSYEHSFDSVGDSYLYIKKDGTSYFNVMLTYLDKNGEAHDLYLSDVANLTETDFAAGYLEEFYNVGSYIRNLGHAPASGNIKFTKVTYFIIGAKDSYTRLYDLKLTPMFELEGAYHSVYNKNVEQLSGTGSYVYNDGVLTMNADSTAGYSVRFTPNVTFKPAELVNLLMDVNATAPFNVSMVVTTDGGDATMEFKNEYFNNFNLETVPEALPAGNHIVDMNLYGYYEWNGGIPAESTVKSVTVTLVGKGTLTLNALQISRYEAINYVKDGAYSSGSLTAQEPEPDPEPDKQQGDINGDGTVNTQDVRLLMLETVFGNTLTAEQLALADYNGDGAVNTQDARAMLQAFTN